MKNLRIGAPKPNNDIVIGFGPDNPVTLTGNKDGSVELNGKKVETTEELTEVVSMLIRIIISNAGGKTDW